MDSDSGLMPASDDGRALALKAGSAFNSQVVKAKRRAVDVLQLNDHFGDNLITPGKQLHLIRSLEQTPHAFIHAARGMARTNLGMARLQVKRLEARLRH